MVWWLGAVYLMLGGCGGFGLWLFLPLFVVNVYIGLDGII